MKILALDPATKTGFAVGDSATRRILTSDTWPLGGSSGGRLADLRRRIRETCEQFGIEKIFYEEASFGAIRGRGKVLQSVLQFHSQLRGIIELVAFELRLPTQAVSPTTIKTMAGSGRADKSQMIRACKTLLGVTPRDDNEADALLLLSLAMQNPGYQPESKRRKREAVRVKREARLF